PRAAGHRRLEDRPTTHPERRRRRTGAARVLGMAAPRAAARPSGRGGVSLWRLSSGEARLIGLLVADHGVEDVAAASGQADEGGVVLLTLGALAVVVGPGGRVLQRREGSKEERALELLVAAPRGVLASDGDAGAVGDRGDARIGGQVA